MSDEPDLLAKFMDIREDIILPMIKERRFAELNDTMTARLADETDDSFRHLAMGELSMSLRVAGEKRLSLAWANRISEEFDRDPLAWADLARWYWFGSPSEPMTRENMRVALGHYETALQRARAADEWVRDILFYICRLLVDMEDWPRLEARMREIVADLRMRRVYDAPRFEGKWLRLVPRGALDPDLVDRYRRLMAADAVRTKCIGFILRPPTLRMLEPRARLFGIRRLWRKQGRRKRRSHVTRPATRAEFGFGRRATDRRGRRKYRK